MQQFVGFFAAYGYEIVKTVIVAHQQLIKPLILVFDQFIKLNQRFGDIVDRSGLGGKMEEQRAAAEKRFNIAFVIGNKMPDLINFS